MFEVDSSYDARFSALSYLTDGADVHTDDADDDSQWKEFTVETTEDWSVLPKKSKVMELASYDLTPSEFTEAAFYFTSHEDGSPVPFSFEGRKYLRRVYDTPARKVLLCCARQVEKSTTIGNRAISYACLIPGFKILYVSPSALQTKTFSNDRLREPIDTSAILKQYTTGMLARNIFEKQFVNRSKITLRYSFLTADRVRGIPSYAIFIDEIQDIIYDNIPVIEQSAAHAPAEYKMFLYSGTPKTLDNTIEVLRANHSTKAEWMVPCDACGSSSGAGRYWNVLGEKNIQKKGLSCERCGKLIRADHPDAVWANSVALDGNEIQFESYRIPQLMVPWRAWSEILGDYHRYPRAQFYNEVLGISYEDGMKPITESELRELCIPTLEIDEENLDNLRRRLLGGTHVYMGIDWGYGQGSFTVVSLGAYMENKFTVFYMKRCNNELLDLELQMKFIIDLARAFNVKYIAADWGAGFGQNDKLTRTFGADKVFKFQYVNKLRKKLAVDTKMAIIKMHRSEIMSDIFSALKRAQLAFFNWNSFRTFASDILNIYSEYSETQRMLLYNHNPKSPDDAFHSILYCFMGSMIDRPRQDIIVPHKEDKTKGPVHNNLYSGNVYQGLFLATQHKILYASDGIGTVLFVLFYRCHFFQIAICC